MKLLDLVGLLDSDITAEHSKIHLASHNGRDDPLDLYYEGRFPKWQSWQSRQNFERSFVIALIQMPVPNQWLFAGAYSTHGSKPHDDGFSYKLREREQCKQLDGRLIVSFVRPSRQTYLKAERWTDELLVYELRAEKLTVPTFPGFKGLHITKSQLDLIARQVSSNWIGPLSSVAGVYLISDAQTGKFYVGSATGEGGLWQRWAQYAATHHGGNRDLKALLGEDRVARASSLQFSVLEIADTHASPSEILARENHWKLVLLTRIHGLNAN